MSDFSRPQELFVSVERAPVAGNCPECGAEALARYPVISEGGWELVTKCQQCLCSVEREPWKRLGPVTLLSDGLS
jgi:uncharacterized Zn finger protein